MAHMQPPQKRRSSARAPSRGIRARAEVVADRFARLQKITTLSETLVPEEIAKVVVGEGMGVFGASAGSLALLTDDGTEIEVVRVGGHEPRILETRGRFPLTSLRPLAVSTRSGEPVWLETSEVWRGPHARSASVHDAARNQDAASMPMFVAGRTVGAIGLNFSEVRAFGRDDRAFFFALAQQCALALERARLYRQGALRESEKRLPEDELRARTRQLAAVVELGQFALASDDLSALFDETVRLSAQVLEVDYCDVVECLPDRGANPSPLRLEHGVTSSASVVIQGKNEPFGILGAHTKRRRTFTASDVHFLQAVAHVLAAALQRKRTEEERARYAQRLTIQVLQAQEDERKRIARELHDETVQALSTLLVNLDLLEPHVSSAPEETFEFERIRSIARRALDGTRVLAHALRPPILDDLGLMAALEALGAEYTQIYGTLVDVTAGPMARERLTPEVELALFRIAQEALTNACKHADAERIHVQISMSNSEVGLVVEDNGRGFDLAHVANPTWHGGLGLHGMRERSVLLGGELTIETAPGQRTRVVLTAPLQEERPILADPASWFQTDERLAKNTAINANVRVLLVDDHAIFREGLSLVLDTQPGITVIGEAEDGREALELVERLRPDVVVMDVAMPRLNGVDATLQIKRRFPDVKVVILTTHESREYLVQIAKVGAPGYVLKRSAGTELVEAVHAAAQGKCYISPTITGMMLDDYRMRIDRSGEDLLTEREREVLQLVAEGLINQVIAAQLAISIKTVQRHRDNIMRKLGAHDRMDLVKYAIRTGMITA